MQTILVVLSTIFITLLGGFLVFQVNTLKNQNKELAAERDSNFGKLVTVEKALQEKVTEINYIKSTIAVLMERPVIAAITDEQATKLVQGIVVYLNAQLAQRVQLPN